MGVPLDIFSLYQLQNEDGNCHHYLLLKVEQPAFRNAIEGEYNHAVEIADKKKNDLIALYKAEILIHECAAPHRINLVGELQVYPVGDDLFDEYGRLYVELWIAETRFGYPWVVMGTAANETAFWREVEQDEDLLSLGPVKPARKQRVFFLTEKANETGY